jgi:hypothetical protein
MELGWHGREISNLDESGISIYLGQKFIPLPKITV